MSQQLSEKAAGYQGGVAGRRLCKTGRTQSKAEVMQSGAPTASLMGAKQLLGPCLLHGIETLPRHDAHTGKDPESGPRCPHASHLLTRLPSTANVPSAAEELTLKFRCILNSPNFNLKTDTRFCFWKTLRHVWNKVDM